MIKYPAGKPYVRSWAVMIVVVKLWGLLYLGDTICRLCSSHVPIWASIMKFDRDVHTKLCVK